MDLKANTAIDVLIGPFVDSTDGNTAETGLTITQADVRLSKNGQNIAQKNDDTTCTADELGYYNCELNATDTNTEGNLVLLVHESGALPVRHEYNVLSEAAWDSLYAADDTGNMDVNVVSMAANVLTATAIDADAITSAKIADNAFGNEHFASGALTSTEITSAAGITLADDAITASKYDESTAFPLGAANGSTLTEAGKTPPTVGEIRTEMETNGGKLDHLWETTEDDSGVRRFTANALEEAPSGAGGDATEAKQDTIIANLGIVDSVVDRIEVDTQDLQTQIGTDGAGLTSIPWNASWDAQVQSECTDALNAYDPPTRAELTTDTNSIITQVNVNESKIDTIDGIVDAILEDTGTTIPGTIATIDNEIATMQGNVTDILTDTGTTIPDQITALNNISEAEVNAQVDLALNTAIPGSPTAASINDYIKRIKFVTVNKVVITHTGGQAVIYNDSDGIFATIAGAYTEDPTTTTRLRLE